MKYALLIYSAPGSSPLPDAEVREAWIDYIKAVKETGVLLGAEQLAGTDTATSVRVRGGQRLLTDGPFLETKEHLAGFFLIDVPDLDAALDWAARMPNSASGKAGHDISLQLEASCSCVSGSTTWLRTSTRARSSGLRAGTQWRTGPGAVPSAGSAWATTPARASPQAACRSGMCTRT
jgi:hypothetical protein